MEYTIDKDGRRIAEKLKTTESYSVFIGNGGEFLGETSTREEAEELRNKSKYNNDTIWIWDNRINN